MLHRHKVVIVVLDVAVIFVQDAERAEDGRLQKHLSLLLQAHDAYGGEKLGNGGQAQGGAGGHGVGCIGLAIAPGIQEGVVPHYGQRDALEAPEGHETVHHLVHGGQVGEVVHYGLVQVFHPVHGVRRFRFREGPGLLSLAAHVQPETSPRQDEEGKDTVYEIGVLHLISPARRPKSMMKSAVPSMPRMELSTHRW